MKWRYIPYRRYDPFFKLGLNKAAMESVSGGANPLVWLSGWDQKTVNVGYSQQIEKRVNLEKAEKRGVKVVRRQGGGGTTFLDPDGEITWHMVAEQDYFPDDVNRIYSRVCGKIAEKLGELGIEAEHEPVNDIVTENGKISGATLKREEGVIYVAGTLLFEVDVEEMFELINPEEGKKNDKQIDDYRQRVTSISQESGASFQEAREILKDALLQGKDFEEEVWKEDEKQRAKHLANKYSSEEWLYRK
ncbi:MAG: biotin/lipoate A/B protein ligase family protein [Candidatus Nanohaloarchaea archaeon]